MNIEKGDAQSSGILMPNSEVHDCIIIENRGTLIFDENIAKKFKLTVEDNVFKIIDMRHEATAGNNMENAPIDNNRERNEERFHFVHPEIEEEEAWRIHNSVKRLVTNQKIPEICIYIKEQREKRKMLLPQSPSAAYKELQRMGMPKGEGYGEKHFSSCYMK